MIWVSVIILLAALFVGLLSVFGLHPVVLRMRFSRIFPPVRFFSNALTGIEKLQALDLRIYDDKGNEVTGQKQGELHQRDVGFNQLIRVIRENTLSKGEYHSIILVEDSAGVKIGDSPDLIRFIVLRKSGEEERLSLHPFDPDKPIRDLRNWVEVSFHRQLAYWMFGFLGIWLIANSYMLYVLNI